MGAGHRVNQTVRLFFLEIWTKVRYSASMHSRRPTPRRHPLASPRGHLRAAERLAGGLRPAAVARLEGVAEAEIDVLLAQPDFQELVESLVELEAMPQEERLRQLEQMAWCTLERAMADDDWRAAAFVLAELRRGRNPARSLARRRAVAPPPPAGPALVGPAALPPCDLLPRDPVIRAIGRCAGALCDEMLVEQAARHAAETATDAAPAVAASAVPASLPRRLDDMAPRLRHGAAGTTVPLAEPRAMDQRLPARAQGP